MFGVSPDEVAAIGQLLNQPRLAHVWYALYIEGNIAEEGDNLLERTGLTISDLQNHVEIPQSTLYNDIAELTEIGAVEVVSDTQPQRYRAVSLEAESKVVEELNEEYAIVNPPLIGLVGQAYLDENVAMFIDEHGYDLLWEVLHAYRRHLTGEGEYHYTELMAPIPNSQLESIVPALRYTLHQTTRDPLWGEDWSEELNASK